MSEAMPGEAAATETTESPQPGLPGRRRNRLVRKAAYGVLGLLGFAVVGFAIAYVLTPVPSTQQVSAREQLNTFYYADGKTIIAQEGTNRQPVTLDKISKPMQQAVISAENRSFYSDPGVSFSGTVRAFWSTVSGGQVQGGSTITQQMVRNYYSGLSQERTVFRKLKEVMVSLKVSQSQEKDWIMEQYLNTIYFGRDSYGIQAAAQAYFKVDAKDLTPAQSAYLAAAIQQPSVYDNVTKKNRANIEARWRYVMDGMAAAGNVSKADADAAKFPKPVKQSAKDIYKGQLGYMVNIAKKELREQRGVSERQLALGGLKITTTFQKPLMDAAVKAVEENVPSEMPKEQRAGLTSVDPTNGEVVAFYGGRDYLKEQLSSSFGLRAQAASGFKPFVLAAALQDGLKLTHTEDGSNGYKGVPNSGGVNWGQINLLQMTENSVNTAYMRLGEEIGPEKITEMAAKLGIPKNQLTDHEIAATYPLGVADVSPAQMAGAYAAFANNGMWHKPHVIKTFTDRNDKTTKVTEKGKRVFDESVAADATYAMQRAVESGTGGGARLYDREVAGKTGTNTNGAAVWFNGFIPQLSTSIGVFHSKPGKNEKTLVLPGYSAYGGDLPARVWRSYMQVATQGMEVKDFPEPTTYAPSYQRQEPTEKPADRPTGTPTTVPTDKPSDKPTDEKPSDKPSPPPEEQEPPVDQQPPPEQQPEPGPGPNNQQPPNPLAVRQD